MNIINITWCVLLTCLSGSDCSTGKGCSNNRIYFPETRTGECYMFCRLFMWVILKLWPRQLGTSYILSFTSPELLLTNNDWMDSFQSPSRKCYTPLSCSPCIIRLFIMWLLQFHHANFVNNSFPRHSLLVERLRTRD